MADRKWSGIKGKKSVYAEGWSIKNRNNSVVWGITGGQEWQEI